MSDFKRMLREDREIRPNPMITRAITLHQPYADLVVYGIKPYETRSWPPGKMLGQTIAIHSAHECPTGSPVPTHFLPRPMTKTVCGAILGFATIAAAVWVTDMGKARTKGTAYCYLPDGGFSLIKTDPFGNYNSGRSIWALTNVHRLPEPIPCKGRQRFWKLTDDLAYRLAKARPKAIHTTDHRHRIQELITQVAT